MLARAGIGGRVACLVADAVRSAAGRIGLIILVWSISGGAQAAEQFEDLRDPFTFGPRGDVTQNATPTSPTGLTGILWDAKNPLAMIDGELLTVGQTVAGWQIVEIQSDRIVLQRGSRQETLVSGASLPSD